MNVCINYKCYTIIELMCQEDLNVNKNNGLHECIKCHYWNFRNINFRFQQYYNVSPSWKKKLIPKKFLTFPEMELFLALTLKNYFYFNKQKFLASYFSYILVENIPNSQNKKTPYWITFLYFRKWNFLEPSFKNFSYFKREL